ncbi:hypothetical protein BB561_001679 [Smittium simulii]|uniref:Ferrochelatase n=1 Tax=Smittium simulii TaxID=133385 RepID=A0A2T9YTL4_9FUNG|nr:hypothetical protein BB561_001679 [Smittium simulii]
MGGPRNINEVNSYLKNIFLDRDIMQLPMQNTLGKFIANRRTSKVQAEYNLIGGGSPIEKWTRLQGKQLIDKLDVMSPETAPHNYYVGFRYNEPKTKTALQNILDDGVDRVVAFSQYFQYSCSTSGSNFNDLYKQQNELDPTSSIKWSFIDRWGTHPLLIKFFADSIQKSLLKVDPDQRDKTPILFSAHSLPLYVVLKGDTYVNEVGATVGCVMAELRNRGVINPYRLVWQSEVGPLKWLGPSTEKVIEKMGTSNLTKNLVVVPIAFSSDHIETLFELGIEYRELAKKSGIDNFILTDSPNDDPTFIDCITDVAFKHLQSPNNSNYQLTSRCHNCVSEQCKITKNWIQTALSK